MFGRTCDFKTKKSVVHQLHTELVHPDIHGKVGSSRQRKVHPTVLAAATLTKCDACQRTVATSTGGEWEACRTMASSVKGQLYFTLEIHTKGTRHGFTCVSGSHLEDISSCGMFGKRIIGGSKTNASMMLVRYLRTSREGGDRPFKLLARRSTSDNGWPLKKVGGIQSRENAA